MRNGCRHFQPVHGWLLTAPVEFHFLAAAASLFARTPDEEPCGRFIPAVGERKSPRRDLTLGFKPHSRGFSQSIYHVYHFTVARACGWACLVMKPLKFPQSADLMPTPQVSRFCRAGLCAHGVKGLVSARLWVAVARAGSWIPHCNAASDGLITQQRSDFPRDGRLGEVQETTKKARQSQWELTLTQSRVLSTIRGCSTYMFTFSI